jgi:hypothetical protein
MVFLPFKTCPLRYTVAAAAQVQSLARTYKDLPYLEQTLPPPDAGAAKLLSGRDIPDRNIMLVSKENKSPNNKEKDCGLQHVLESEIMIAIDASEENESLE